MADMNRTQAMGAPPVVDPNRTIMGSPLSLNVTATIKPVQCPVCRSSNPPGLKFCMECGLIFEMALPEDAFGAPAVQLPVLVMEDGRELKLRPGANSVGRQGDCVIEDVRVSRRHAEFTLAADGSVMVRDLGSTNGTQVEGQPAMASTPLAQGQTVSLGGVVLRLSMSGEAAKTALPNSGRTAALAAAPTTQAKALFILEWEGGSARLPEGEHTLGRREGVDIVLADGFVSGRHGVLRVSETGVMFEDLGSTNGSFVNGAQLPANQPTEITPDDELKLGHTAMRLKVAE